jgi:hypothetical protein
VLTARYLIGAGLMLCYIGVQSQNPPVAHSPDSDRENQRRIAKQPSTIAPQYPRNRPYLGPANNSAAPIAHEMEIGKRAIPSKNGCGHQVSGGRQFS